MARGYIGRSGGAAPAPTPVPTPVGRNTVWEFGTVIPAEVRVGDLIDFPSPDVGTLFQNILLPLPEIVGVRTDVWEDRPRVANADVVSSGARMVFRPTGAEFGYVAAIDDWIPKAMKDEIAIQGPITKDTELVGDTLPGAVAGWAENINGGASSITIQNITGDDWVQIVGGGGGGNEANASFDTSGLGVIQGRYASGYSFVSVGTQNAGVFLSDVDSQRIVWDALGGFAAISGAAQTGRTDFTGIASVNSHYIQAFWIGGRLVLYVNHSATPVVLEYEGGAPIAPGIADAYLLGSQQNSTYHARLMSFGHW